MNKPAPALITLGSNINPAQNLPQAIDRLGRQAGIAVQKTSPVYETAPVGGQPGQPVYHNAAMLIETSLEPAALKQTLLNIEAAMGRVRTANKYAPRPIDLDIAYYGGEILELAGRSIPDPEAARLAHLALPLADVAPNWVHPELGVTLAQLITRLNYSQKEIRKL
jgi:2-amino-4-hydroxy-6-hydroxymethyldihydropteridine diphosphokinase